MASSYSVVKDYVLTPNVTVGASETNTVVSQVFPITHHGSKNIRIKIVTASTTVTNAINFKLQHVMDAEGTWVSMSKSAVSITGNGDFYLTFNIEVSGDQADLPLMSLGRIVVTTGVSDTTKITSVKVLQGL